MDLGSALKVLLRRWLVVLLGLALTLGAGYYLYTNTPPSYQATARMLLLLPADARGAEEDGSPFLYLPNGLNVLAQVVVAAPTSREFHAQMVDEGFTSVFEVGVDVGSPIITVSAEDEDPEKVIATRDEVVKAIQAELVAAQQEVKVPPQQTAQAKVFSAEDTPQQMSGSGLRGILAIVAIGGLITLLAAFAIDRLMQIIAGWRGKRGKRAVDENVTDEDTPEEDVTDEDTLDEATPDEDTPDEDTPDEDAARVADVEPSSESP